MLYWAVAPFLFLFYWNVLSLSQEKCVILQDNFLIILNMEEQNNNGQLQIELREEVAQGTYANLAIITHSSSEFILDFVRVMPGIPKAGVQSRIIVAPEHAKRLLRALEDNIAKYERVFGSIRISDESLISPLASVKGEA